jgi:hypothetical protein
MPLLHLQFGGCGNWPLPSRGWVKQVSIYTFRLWFNTFRSDVDMISDRPVQVATKCFIHSGTWYDCSQHVVQRQSRSDLGVGRMWYFSNVGQGCESLGRRCLFSWHALLGSGGGSVFFTRFRWGQLRTCVLCMFVLRHSLSLVTQLSIITETIESWL